MSVATRNQQTFLPPVAPSTSFGIQKEKSSSTPNLNPYGMMYGGVAPFLPGLLPPPYGMGYMNSGNNNNGNNNNANPGVIFE